MVFLSSGCPRGRWSSRSCRVHWKQRARRNHGSIRPQGLQCKASESVCINNSVRSCLSPVLFLIQNMFYIYIQRVTQERRVNKDLKVLQVKEWVLFYECVVHFVLSWTWGGTEKHTNKQTKQSYCISALFVCIFCLFLWFHNHPKLSKILPQRQEIKHTGLCQTCNQQVC